MKKGLIQIDYVIAIGMFILVLAFIINFLTDYVKTSEETLNLLGLRSETYSLLDTLVSYETDWNHSDVSTYPEALGLNTQAYRLFVKVTNTDQYTRSGGEPTNLVNELVSVNITGFDENSIVVYDESENIVTHDIQDNEILFNVNITTGKTKWFEITYDDNSNDEYYNFTDHSGTVETNLDNITETKYPIQIIDVIQYKKIQSLNNSDISQISQNIDIDEFAIKIFDTSNNEYLNVSTEDIPTSANVIALQRAIVYQNSTAGLEKGKLRVYVW